MCVLFSLQHFDCKNMISRRAYLQYSKERLRPFEPQLFKETCLLMSLLEECTIITVQLKTLQYVYIYMLYVYMQLKHYQYYIYVYMQLKHYQYIIYIYICKGCRPCRPPRNKGGATVCRFLARQCSFKFLFVPFCMSCTACGTTNCKVRSLCTFLLLYAAPEKCFDTGRTAQHGF